MELSHKQIESLKEMLAQPRLRIVILSHTNPDGDAVGSSLAWAEVLRARGHEVTCVVPNKYPYFLDWMPGIEEVVVFKTDTEGRAVKAIAEADVLFCLDFNAVSRLEILSETIQGNTTARRVLIDHHLQPDEGFDIVFSHPESSSTCFLVYCLVEAMYGTGAITRRMGELLYVGMMTDTGNFAFSHLTPELFRAVAVLLEKGISIPEIHNSVYNAYTEGRARLFGYAINRKMALIEDGGLHVAARERDAPLPVPAGRQRGLRELRPDDQEGQDVGHVPGPPQVHPHLAPFARGCGREPLRPQVLQRRRPQECRRRQVLPLDGGDHRPLHPFGPRVRRGGSSRLRRWTISD